MALYTNTFEGGTPGDSITTANSGGLSGDAFGTVQPTTGALWTYSNTAAIIGSIGASRTLDTTSGYLRGDDPAPSGRGGLRRPLTIEALPTATMVVAQVRDASDTLMCNLSLRTTGRIRVAPAGVEVAASESPVLTVGQTYWMELILTPGASSTTGRVELLITDLAGTTVHTYDSGLASNINTTNPPARYRLGGFSNAAGWTVDKMDEVRWGSLASGWIGSNVTGPTPVVTQAKRYVADFRSSIPGSGGSLAYSIAHVSGPNNTGTITEAVEGLFHIPMDNDLESVYRVTVQEGAQSANYDITVPVSGVVPASPDSVQRLYYDGAAWV